MHNSGETRAPWLSFRRFHGFRWAWISNGLTVVSILSRHHRREVLLNPAHRGGVRWQLHRAINARMAA